eukprot:UN04460
MAPSYWQMVHALIPYLLKKYIGPDLEFWQKEGEVPLVAFHIMDSIFSDNEDAKARKDILQFWKGQSSPEEQQIRYHKSKIENNSGSGQSNAYSLAKLGSLLVENKIFKNEKTLQEFVSETKVAYDWALGIQTGFTKGGVAHYGDTHRYTDKIGDIDLNG